MNQADTPNNGDFVEALTTTNSLQPQQVTCPFDSVNKSENTAVAKQPLLAPTENKQCESEIPSEQDVFHQDWVAEPNSKKQEIIETEFQKLLELNEELRSANDDLYDTVRELKATLTESEMALQWQKKRSTVTESMLNQQTQELTAAQEQANSLFQQLETTVQTVQRQESLIENYKAQLEMSQQRLAQLERECTLMKSSCNEQSHQLVQSENSCRDLRTRLMRQQRQTLQFKAALEKCLETPAPTHDFLDTHDLGSSQTKPSKHSSFLFCQAQPIRPWSGAEFESFTDSVDNPYGTTTPSPLYQCDDSIAHPSSSWDTTDSEETFTQTQPADTAQPEMETVSSLGSASLEEQLDDVLQMFFVANPVSTSAQPPAEKDVPSTFASEAIWETSVIPLASEPETAQTLLSLDSPEESEDYWIQISQLSSVELSENTDSQEPTNYDTNSNSPSPVVYPQRPAKRRKSLAAVELPNFRPKSH